MYCCFQVTRSDGHGSIANPNEVHVTKQDGSVESIKTKNILLATGSEVTPFPGIDVSKTMVLTVNHRTPG